ncbi:MAG: hypothetical protein MN733_32235 [Nitrososphaera sp.]|nr:hypothetical protein [Nitrososphaera sp.]
MDKQTQDLAEDISMDKPVFSGGVATYAPLQVGDAAFHFDAVQIRFIYFYQKFGGDLRKACSAVFKDVPWGEAFIQSKKYKRFMRKTLALEGANRGALAKEWWETGLAGMRGFREFYVGTCPTCKEENRLTAMEYAMMQDDNLVAHPKCEVCLQPMKLSREMEPYKPTREMVQHWDGIGARVVPKVERVQHEFTDEKFRFETDDSVISIAPGDGDAA